MNSQSPDLKKIFSGNYFNIPQYQRAYAWEEEPHLTDFLADLRQQVQAQKKSPDKRYFLGTFLLHENQFTGKVDIVDGQQRLTTSVIFIAAALSKNQVTPVLVEKNIKVATLKRLFIFDEDEDVQKLKTINEDNDFFRTQILEISEGTSAAHSRSSERLFRAKQFFLDNIKDSEWSELIDVLIASQVMSYVVHSAADATQIFELQNDRGKNLTELEALKSYLMHMVYLHDKSPDDRLDLIQHHFSEIYRNIEVLSDKKRAPDEDSIFSYHCAAFMQWSGDDWRKPKNLIKKIISQKEPTDIPKWIEKFVAELKISYRSVADIYHQLDTYNEMSDLLVLGRLAPFWPLILKIWHTDKKDNKPEFRKTVRLMEVYSFRGYGISNLRADGGLSTLYTLARDFQSNEALNKSLYEMCSWYDLDERFLNGLDTAKIYKSNRSDVQYLLWKYENHLRSQTGRKQPQLSWQDYLQPTSKASKFSVEHIAAQSHAIANSKVCWQDNEEPQSFADVAMHRLGNLVIDSISTNAAKGKKDFADKLKQLSESSTYLSQGELINFADNSSTLPLWSLESVVKRHQLLIEFAKNNWDPKRYL